MRMSARVAFKEKISFIKIPASNKVRDRFFDEWNMRIGKICSLEKEINVVYNIIAEDIFQFILNSYFIGHKTIISEISRIFNPAFFNSKESKFKVNVLKLNKIDKIRNFDIYEIWIRSVSSLSIKNKHHKII